MDPIVVFLSGCIVGATVVWFAWVEETLRDQTPIDTDDQKHLDEEA